MGIKHILFFYTIAKLIPKHKLYWFIAFAMIGLDLIIPKVEIRAQYGYIFFLITIPLTLVFPIQSGFNCFLLFSLKLIAIYTGPYPIEWFIMDPAVFYALILTVNVLGLILYPFLLYFLETDEF